MNCDFTKYSYQHYENAINIGWNRNNSITNIDIDKEFMNKLKIHCENPINMELNGKYREVYINEKKCVSGFGEIRILDFVNNKKYAAPNIIYEEINDGFYVPPKPFVEAVKKSPSPYEDEYKKYMTHYSEDFYWGENEKTVKKINKAIYLLLNDEEGFKEFMQDKSNLQIVTHKGSLLNHAIMENKEKLAIFLIDEGIDINAFEGIELINSIKKDFTGLAELLIEKNIEMDISEIKVNPLMIAINCHNNYIAKKLIKERSELMVTYNNMFVRNFTVLDMAQKFNNSEIIDILK